MKKLMASLLMSAAMVFGAYGQDLDESVFYNKTNGYWSTYGKIGTPGDSPGCWTETTWTDGSRLQLIKDLYDGQIYVWLQNVDWNIVDDSPPGWYDGLMINFYNRSGQVVQNWRGGFELINKNTIVIPGLKVDTFIVPFADASEMVLVMPGTTPNMGMPLDGTTVAVRNVIECIDRSEKFSDNDLMGEFDGYDGSLSEEERRRFNI